MAVTSHFSRPPVVVIGAFRCALHLHVGSRLRLPRRIPARLATDSLRRSPGIDTEGTTLLDWVLRNYPDTPRTRARQWICMGRVSVNGEVIRKPHQILPDPGGALELRSRHNAGVDWGSGWQIHPRVCLLYLDRALAVVNKGPGILSVPGSRGGLSALSVLADVLAGRLELRGGGSRGRQLPPALLRLQPLPVHRLDLYTSGVLCMAMNPAARRNLIEQVRTRRMKREYVAFVEGRAAAPEGTWRQLLQLSEDELRQQVVQRKPAKSQTDSRTREAVTHYQVLTEYPIAGGQAFVTKLRLQLETGLRHQIRVQAATAGLPLVGDRTYNARVGGQASRNRLLVFPRQALHSETLTLEHPERPGQSLTWSAPLPPDLVRLEHALRRGSGPA